MASGYHSEQAGVQRMLPLAIKPGELSLLTVEFRAHRGLESRSPTVDRVAETKSRFANRCVVEDPSKKAQMTCTGARPMRV